MAIRNGKIANLPNDIREQLNLRLLEGESGRELAAWLNALPDVQSTLASQFNAVPISEVNLTHWRQGGYLQWLTERECFDSARALADGDCNLATTGLSAERLLNVLTLRIGQLLMRWDFSPDAGVSDDAAFSEVARKARILQGISRSLLAIHRIQSQSARQKSEPTTSSEPSRRGAGGGKERGEPPNSRGISEKGASASPAAKGCLTEARIQPNPTGTKLSESPTAPASSSAQSAEPPGNCVGLATTREKGEPIRNLQSAIRNRRILSGPISPASISRNLTHSPVKADLDLSELLHAV